MAFWHADLVHAVDAEHRGPGDSAVFYIPAMPATPANAAYVRRQAEKFAAGSRPHAARLPAQRQREVGFAGRGEGRTSDLSALGARVYL